MTIAAGTLNDLSHVLLSSRIFCREWYQKQCSVVWKSEADALAHYLSSGWRRGYDPGPLFSTAFFLDQAAQAGLSVQSPLIDYVTRPEAWAVAPHPLFDPTWYRLAASAPFDGAPLAHYLANGGPDERDPHPLFRSAFVRGQAKDLGWISSSTDDEHPLLERYVRAGREADVISPHPLVDAAYIKEKIGSGGEQRATLLETYLAHPDVDPHPLFDRAGYRMRNPGTEAFEPLIHYVVHGARENRAPHWLFDPAWYVAQRPEADGAALEHWLADQGDADFAGPHPLFDSRFYAEQYGARGSLGHIHYVADRDAALRQPHILFDGAWYLRQNPGVRASGMHPLRHYLVHGSQEGRSPHPLFDEAWYRQTQMLSGEPNVPGLVHYILVGARRGARPNPVFDPEHYGRQTAIAANESALEHYVRHGAASDADPHPLFDNDWYRNTYLDPVEDDQTLPLAHYLAEPQEPVRDPSPQFDAAHYVEAVMRPAGVHGNPLVHYCGRGDDAAPADSVFSFGDIRTSLRASLVSTIRSRLGDEAIAPDRRRAFRLSTIAQAAQETPASARMLADLGSAAIQFKTPGYLNRDISGSLITLQTPKRYLAEASDVACRTATRLLIDRSGEIVLHDEYAGAHGAIGHRKTNDVDIANDRIFLRRKALKRSYECAIHLMHEYESDFFHWITEVLPRLVLAEQIGATDVPLLRTDGLHRNLERLFQFVNVRRFRSVKVGPLQWVHVHRCIVPSDVAFMPDVYRGEPRADTIRIIGPELEEVRARVLRGVLGSQPQAANGSPTRHIYLRRGQRNRALLNEEALVGRLRSAGVEIFDVDELSIEAQVRLFNEAASIIAPTGAVLANILWGRSGARVVCVMSDHPSLNPFFWQQLGSAAGAEVSYLIGQRAGDIRGRAAMHDNFIVDIDETMSLLKKGGYLPDYAA